MSKLLIPNTTQVPNVILDRIMRTLAPGALKVLFAICRLTYGWGKKSDRISLSQLQEITGMSRWSVVRSLKQLDRLILVKPGSHNMASEYQLNVEISDVDLVTLSDQSQKVTSHFGSHRRVTFQTYSKQRRNTGAKAPSVSSPICTERKPIRRGAGIPPELQPAVSRVIARINDLGGTRYRDDKPDALEQLIARLNGGATGAECMAVVEYQWRRWGDDDKMIDHFNPVTLFRESNFQKYLQNAQRAAGNGHSDGPPKIVKREGDTLTLADGSITPAGTYQRRYGIQL
jgi:phage replication O-like protein O